VTKRSLAQPEVEVKERYGWETNIESALGDYAWYGSNPDGQSHSVDLEKPNVIGIYVMSEHVWEWVQDIYKKRCVFKPTDK
jgi:formylglycine-generating enzyme required for sulfatase activity